MPLPILTLQSKALPLQPSTSLPSAVCGRPSPPRPAFRSLVRVVRRCSCCCVTLLLAADVSWRHDKHPRVYTCTQSRTRALYAEARSFLVFSCYTPTHFHTLSCPCPLSHTPAVHHLNSLDALMLIFGGVCRRRRAAAARLLPPTFGFGPQRC